MASNKELAELRKEKLLDDYRRLSAIVEYGKQKYSHAWIVAHLEQRHYYTQSYIEFLLKTRL